MPIDRANLEEVTEADLLELVSNGVSESERIEYKGELCGSADQEKRELLKDVSAFMNRLGGHLIVGIPAKDGVPFGPIGVDCPNGDAEAMRMDSIIRTGLEPTPADFRVRQVLLADGKSCFIVRVPQSWNLPHRVSYKGTSRVYVRNSAGAHEASMDELRRLFGFGAGVADRIRHFREERLEVVRQINPIDFPKSKGAFVLHLIPLASLASGIQVAPSAAMKFADQLRPIGNGGYSPRYVFEGFNCARGEERDTSYTQVFRNGVVEAVRAPIVFSHGSHPVIAGLKLEREVIEAMPRLMAVIAALGVPPPIAVVSTFDGVDGAHYAVRATLTDYDDGPKFFRVARLLLPDSVVEGFGDNAAYERALQPGFDAMWNAMGFARDEYYDDHGNWIGERRS